MQRVLQAPERTQNKDRQGECTGWEFIMQWNREPRPCENTLQDAISHACAPAHTHLSCSPPQLNTASYPDDLWECMCQCLHTFSVPRKSVLTSLCKHSSTGYKNHFAQTTHFEENLNSYVNKTCGL